MNKQKIVCVEAEYQYNWLRITRLSIDILQSSSSRPSSASRRQRSRSRTRSYEPDADYPATIPRRSTRNS